MPGKRPECGASCTVCCRINCVAPTSSISPVSLPTVHRYGLGMAEKTRPNPTIRCKASRKHPLLVDAQGIPVNVILTKANRPDVTQLLPLVDGVYPIRGKRGWPLKKPKSVQADRAYDSRAHRLALEQRGIGHQIAKRRAAHGSNLGTTRWVVERTIAWLHQFRRLRVRYERLPSIQEAFFHLGCALICWRILKNSFC
ncbi:transposase, IS4 family [Noviherbaspirillum suwonense]|uniref:Transposase, IS4 family n=1 Tax=Noviherbaspirillum suwonense TaxID=1224511 RepID=A0ABY1Q3N3_9BURK|nr:transposase, IS4 family [Noviherbaspirillum suwonense]